MAFHWRLIALDSLKPVSSINRSITRLQYPLRYRGFGCARSLLVPLQSGLPEYSFSCSPSQQSVVYTFYGLYHAGYKAWNTGSAKSGLIHKRGSRALTSYGRRKPPIWPYHGPLSRLARGITGLSIDSLLSRRQSQNEEFESPRLQNATILRFSNSQQVKGINTRSIEYGTSSTRDGYLILPAIYRYPLSKEGKCAKQSW